MAASSGGAAGGEGEAAIKRAAGTFDLEAVYRLDLSQRGLVRLWPALGRCVNLRSLDLSGNALEECAGLEAGALARLETLRLTGNRLRSLEGLPELPALRRLYVNDNALESVESLRGRALLTHLDVRGNPVSARPDDVLRALPQLRFLNCEPLEASRPLRELAQELDGGGGEDAAAAAARAARARWIAEDAVPPDGEGEVELDCAALEDELGVCAQLADEAEDAVFESLAAAADAD